VAPAKARANGHVIGPRPPPPCLRPPDMSHPREAGFGRHRRPRGPEARAPPR